jgi:hypothetical protein
MVFQYKIITLFYFCITLKMSLKSYYRWSSLSFIIYKYRFLDLKLYFLLVVKKYVNNIYTLILLSWKKIIWHVAKRVE